MADILEKSLLNVLEGLEQVDKDRLWVDTEKKVNKLAKAVQLALYALDEIEIQNNGVDVSIINARRSLEEACKP